MFDLAWPRGFSRAPDRRAATPKSPATATATAPAPAPAPAPAAEADIRFELLFKASGEGLMLCDASGTILACNLAAAQLHAQPANALVGRKLVDMFVPAAQVAHRELAGDERWLSRGVGAPQLVKMRLSPLLANGLPQRLVHLRAADEALAAPDSTSTHDDLTGLPNRALFRDRLGLAMERAKRTNEPLALMFVGLDRFKSVIDSRGHDVGDRLLQDVARQLTQCVRRVDSVIRSSGDPVTVSRHGGDEFTLIVESVGGSDGAALVAQRVLDALNVPFAIGDEEIVVTTSIGISMFPTEHVDMDELIRHTNIAMSRSKSRGGAKFTFFSDEMNAAVLSRLALESGLRRAIEREEFVLHYQPKVDLRSGEVTGVEALIRWECPGRGLVPPDRFIAVLEETGLLLPVGAWVIRAACADLAKWDRAGLPRLTMAVNVSARQFRHEHFAALIDDTLRERYIDPGRLELELTETLVMEDDEVNRNMLESLAQIGVRLAIDDFGTGYSSLSYLKRFKIDTLKIDRSFVRDLPDSTDDAAIASAVVALGNSLQMRVVAEGVETERQADYLRGLGCDEIQGYLLSRPMPAAAVEGWVIEHQRKLGVRKRAFGRGDSRAMPLLSIAAQADATAD